MSGFGALSLACMQSLMLFTLDTQPLQRLVAQLSSLLWELLCAASWAAVLAS